jgi:hypothetical protein
MKNELKENKVKTHTEAIKNKEGKAVGHKTTKKAEGKNWKAEATHAKAEEKGYKMESYSESYSYSSDDDFDDDFDDDDDYEDDYSCG